MTRADCGIYRITNTVTGEFYLGRAACFGTRWMNHMRLLLKGSHHSPKFQASFDAHGLTAFRFEVLEVCNEQDLAAREVYWFLTLRPTLNQAEPDYDAAARGEPSPISCSGPRKRIDPRTVCACGARKKSENRICRKCMNRERRQMLDRIAQERERKEAQAEREAMEGAIERRLS